MCRDPATGVCLQVIFYIRWILESQGFCFCRIWSSGGCPTCARANEWKNDGRKKH